MTSLKPSVFVKAAKYLTKFEDYGFGCCEALRMFEGYEEHREFLRKYFRTTKAVYWWPYYDKKSQLARSIALLLCAEMVKDMRGK